MLNILVLSVLVFFGGGESKSFNSLSQMLSIELSLNLEDYFNKIVFFLSLSDRFGCNSLKASVLYLSLNAGKCCGCVCSHGCFHACVFLFVL